MLTTFPAARRELFGRLVVIGVLAAGQGGRGQASGEQGLRLLVYHLALISHPAAS